MESCALVPQDLNDTLIRSSDVFISPVSIHGAKPDPEAWESVINKLGNRVDGKVWVNNYLELESALDEEGNVAGYFKVTSEKDGPTHIAIVFAPGWRDVDFGQFDRYMDDRQVIRFHCKNIDRGASIFFSSRKVWEIVLAHEIFHALGVPENGSPNWKNGHCVRRECVMYPSLHVWNIFRVLRHGYPDDLCDDCVAQIEAAKTERGK